MRRGSALGLLATAALLGGCTQARVSVPPHEQVTPGLVTHSEAMVALAGPRVDETGWEFSRRDPPVYPHVIPDFRAGHIVEIRHREHLRTINGRPREFSTTRSQSIRWFEVR